MPTSRPTLLPRPLEMIAHLDKSVRGQTKAKKDIANAVYNHYLSQAERERSGNDLGRHHILILGPTGSGKTFIVKTLAEYLGFPVSFASATSLVQSGYKGRSPDDLVRALLQLAGNDPRLAERGIIFIDEIDKIRSQETGGQRDIAGEGVQNALLTMLDGRIADSVDSEGHKPVDTSRILFICTGAFVGLPDIVESRLGDSDPPLMGFPTRVQDQVDDVPNQPVYESLCKATTNDFVAFGMIPEFVGRFATVTALHELGRTDMRAIIGEATEGSALERQRRLAAIHGIELEITSDALDEIVDDAFRLGTGARGLHRLIGVAVDAVDYRWGDLADDGVTKVTIDRACVLGKGDPVLERGERRLVRQDEELRRGYLPSAPAATPESTPPSFSDTSTWSDERRREYLERLKVEHLGWTGDPSSSAEKWWTAFEKENVPRIPLVIRLAEELRNRRATITEFFLAYVYSNCDNIQANLLFLDYTRLKREEERKKRKAAGDDEPK